MSYLFKLDIAALEAQLLAEELSVQTMRKRHSPAESRWDARWATLSSHAARQMALRMLMARRRWGPNDAAGGATIWYMDADAVPHVPAGFQFPYMKPYFLTSADQFRSPPPLADLTGQVNEVVDIVKNRTPAQAASAIALNMPAGTMTPAGFWGEKAVAFIKKRNMDERAAAHVYALVNTAIMDAVIGCWRQSSRT